MSNDNILKQLFAFNLEATAIKFNLLKKPSFELNEKEVVQLLNFAERLSHNPIDEDKIKSFLICALIWENKKPEWVALESFISRILINIGLSTSAKMVGWNNETSTFNSFNSVIEEVYSSIRLSNHEVILGNQNILLSELQKRIWDAIEKYDKIGISAPTSAGKSFVLINKAIDLLIKKDGKILFIVPTISLINQVTNDLRKKLKELQIDNISVSQTVNETSLFDTNKIIYVLTQERALSAINHKENGLDNLLLLIVDEIQNIEKVTDSDEERSKILFDAVQSLKNDSKPKKIVICGPRLKNINSLVKKWFGNEGFSVSEIVPSVLNISFSFKKIKRKKTIEFSQYLPLGYSNSIEIEDSFLIKDKILGKKTYSVDMNNFVYNLISQEPEAGCIVFAGKTREANDIANALSEKFEENINRTIPEDLENISMQRFIAKTVHPDYSLVSTVKNGIAFHHSKVPPHIRLLIEKAFSKRLLNTIVSTTTLMQGVNLPAKNIIIRNPSVGQKEKLTGYEFTNLKGRAGRLMKDLVGRAIIIDEELCNQADIDLAKQEEKNLQIGYGERFQNNKDLILKALIDNSTTKMETSKVNDLIVYIRVMALKYGEEGLKRIKEVGIEIEENDFNTINERLSKLPIPKNLCISNPYWDPVVLNNIYLKMKNNNWPAIQSRPFGAANTLFENLRKLSSEAYFYFDKYLGIDFETGEGKIKSLCIFAESWAQGKPLCEVINPVTWPIEESEEIDNRIADIQSKVVYGITKLLRPVFQINDMLFEDNSSNLLSYIEMGSFKPELRLLVEIGIPRESAIEFLEQLPNIKFINDDGRIDESRLKKFILMAQQSNSINRWHKLLIEDL